MTWNPRLWRLAVRIEAAYEQSRRRRTPETVPWCAWQNLSDALRRRDKAERRGWRQARRIEQDRLTRDLEHLLSELRTLRGALQTRQAQRLPPAGEIYAELAAAEEEFGTVDVHDDELFVTTEAIHLEGISLGPFELRLNLARLDEQEPYRITALEPHPANGHPDTTHPHVSQERICLGEGKAPAAAALADGRLSDLFQLLNRVLHTYGEGSAFVEMDRWFGTPCADCDETMDEDFLCSCRGCDNSLCIDCARICQHCNRAACHECASICYSCEETTCHRCLSTCAACEEEFCACCQEEGVCHACEAAAEEERAADAEDSEEAADESESPVHTDGLGETVVLARPRHHRNRRLRNLGPR